MQPRSSSPSVRVTKTAACRSSASEVATARSSIEGAACSTATARVARASSRVLSWTSRGTSGGLGPPSGRAVLRHGVSHHDRHLGTKHTTTVPNIAAWPTRRPCADRPLSAGRRALAARPGATSDCRQEPKMRALTPARSDPVPTVLAESQPDGAVRCGVCAHRCLVRPGRIGICGVRENRDGQLISLAYGGVVAMRPRSHREEAALPRRARTARLLHRHRRLPLPLHASARTGRSPRAPALGLDLPDPAPAAGPGRG